MKVHDPPENSRSDEPAASIEEFLRKRDELDQAIRDRFQRPIAVVFTDIAASTDYFERRGTLRVGSCFSVITTFCGSLLKITEAESSKPWETAG